MNSNRLEALLKFLSSDKPYIRQSPEEFRLNRNIMTQASRNNKKEFFPGFSPFLGFFPLFPCSRGS